MVARRIGLHMVAAGFFILLLTLLGSLNFGLETANAEFPNYSGVLYKWATFAAVMWLGLLPLLLILLETRTFGTTRWAVSVHAFSRLIPFIVISTPIGIFYVHMCVSAMQGTEGFLSLFFLLPLLPVLYFLSLILNQIIRPLFVWQKKLKQLQAVASGNATQEMIVEVPLHPKHLVLNSVRESFAKMVKNMELLLDGGSGNKPEVLSAPAVGMLAQATVKSNARKSLSGAVVIIQRQQLRRARDWEFDVLKDWIVSAYRYTPAPIWIVGDWVGDLAPASAQMKRHIGTIDSLIPYVSGFERYASAGQSVLTFNTPDNIAECLRANSLIAASALEDAGLNKILSEAFTPVAVLLRNIFGYSDLTDRLDALLRATETSVAFFSLVLAAEHEAAASDQTASPESDRLDRAIKMAFSKPPEFTSWESLLNSFCRKPVTELAAKVRHALDGTASPVSMELREMLDVVGGARAVKRVKKQIDTRKETLPLLISIRNVTAAHGPTTERVVPELYAAVLEVALELVTALPWNSAVIEQVDATGSRARFQGCIPERVPVSSQAAPDSGHVQTAPGIYASVDGRNSESEQMPQITMLKVSQYFYTAPGARSVAMYIGEKGFFDPVAGMRI